MHWRKITLTGVGLLGGSLGLALKQRRLADEVVGYVRRPASVDECAKRGAVDRATCDLRQAIAQAELVVMCTPIARMRELIEQMLPALRPGTVLTDVGSAKASLVREVEPLASRAGAHFVGSHPMAGNEKMGVQAASADLFEDAVCVVTPTPQAAAAAVAQVEGLWTAVGARVMRLTPEAHDELVSRSSHLPHIVA
ncbi:MAG: prephenate dehydrogenase/arogenate dehydrogenase family protein, partial [Verrucomicrobia bacterium]|nr:prephenate dehydrogenase/arogenate dehydrogenase family protein [Verrucomicrobiota bacterium]